MRVLAFIFLLIMVTSAVAAETYFYAGVCPIAKKDAEGFREVYVDRLGTDTETKSLPFGQVTRRGDRFGFTGKEQDNSRLQYFGARYYDGDLGRFLSVDPVPDQKAYQYVGNDPLNAIDPTGMAGGWRGKIVKEIVEEGAERTAREAPETLRHAKGIRHFSFGAVIPDNLLRQNSLRFKVWLTDWWHHSSDVSIATDMVVDLLNDGRHALGGRKIKQLPDNYLHDIEKTNLRFVEAENQLTILERRMNNGELTKPEFLEKMKPHLNVIREVHSNVVAHHLINREAIAKLDDDQVATLLIESATDWVHASMNRGSTAKNVAEAVTAYRASPAFGHAVEIATERFGSASFMDDVTRHIGDVFTPNRNVMKDAAQAGG